MKKILTALAITALLAGCGGNATPAAGPGASGAGVSGDLTVLAAASLTGSFDRIGKDFERANPGVKITFSYGGSSGLAHQITAGAPADVFAAASPATMKTVTDAGDAAGDPAVFVRNQLVIAVPKKNPKGIEGLADLTKPGVQVALCAEQVPCGAAAATALGAAGVRLTPVTLERDVKSALSKVRLGEVDAALVYRTDARAAAADVEGIEFPESAGAINDYPIVALRNAPNAAAAAAFVAFVRTEPELKVLTDAGFQKP
ncbi:molybdate ABC transporter substrate-binding protein [Paractinoplanes rhizophilus]|uniref:Molybdate ABC transporter substrate-binding protein n=1 Tax=Paractinoplanes rhizophilus TaxID=1416877 RepID=A0ABW2HQE3_9ACTN|nr:molybdate ABC transporter substrate-binding protein [Actinoplanes sp.]